MAKVAQIRVARATAPSQEWCVIPQDFNTHDRHQETPFAHSDAQHEAIAGLVTRAVASGLTAR